MPVPFQQTVQTQVWVLYRVEQKLVVLTQPTALVLHLFWGKAIEDDMADPDVQIIPRPDAAEMVSHESMWCDVCELANEMPLPYVQIDIQGSASCSRQDLLQALCEALNAWQFSLEEGDAH